MVQKIVYRFSKYLYYKFAYKKENEEKRQNLLKEIKSKHIVDLKIEDDSKKALNDLFDGVLMNCFDIGGANDLQPHWFKIQHHANFYMFEPDKRSFSELLLKKKNFENYFIFNFGLGRKNEVRTFYLYNEKTGSTLYDFKNSYKQDYSNKYIYPIKKIEIETRSFDSILDEINVQFINLIKLDVQGAELEILQGLTNKEIWRNIYGVELEVNFQDVYEGAATYEDVKQFFALKGFTLFDLRICRHLDFNYEVRNEILDKYFMTNKNIPSISAKIWEADHVYIRDLNWVLSNIKDFFELKKYIIVLITYHYYYDAIKTCIEWTKINSIYINEKSKLIESILKVHKMDRKNLINYENYLSSVDYKLWAQYMEVEYPNN